MTYKYVHHFWQRFLPLSEIMNIFKGILGLLKIILFEPIFFFNILVHIYETYFLLCFRFTPFHSFISTAGKSYAISRNVELWHSHIPFKGKHQARNKRVGFVVFFVLFCLFKCMLQQQKSLGSLGTYSCAYSKQQGTGETHLKLSRDLSQQHQWYSVVLGSSCWGLQVF